MNSLLKKAGAILATLVIISSISFYTISPVFAQTTSTPTISRLGELLVLDNLFGGGSTTTQTNPNVSRLGELIVLDNLFGGGSGVVSQNGTVSRLGELIVLDNLFNRS